MDQDAAQLIDKFCHHKEHSQGRSPVTVDKYRAILTDLGAFLGNEEIHQASYEELSHFTGVHLHKKGLLPRSRRVYVACIHQFYGWLRKIGVTSDDVSEDLQYPLSGFRLPKGMQAKFAEILLTAPDLSRLSGVRDCAMIMLMLGCGLRVSELCALNKSDLYFEYNKTCKHECLTIRVLGKGNKERLIPAPDMCWASIRAYLGHPLLQKIDNTLPKGDEVVFVSLTNTTVMAHDFHGEKRRISTSAVYKIIKRYGEESNIPPDQCHPHALRHRFATELAENNVDLINIQRAMGHASATTTQIYIEMAQNKMRRELNERGAFKNIRTPFDGIMEKLEQ